MNWETFKTMAYWLIAAAIVVGGFYALSAAARAADLGGTCCVDLEERIAELEATVARKGNRKMSVTISGEINKAIRLQDWDDATLSVHNNGATVGSVTLPTSAKSQDIIDNSASPSKVTIHGSAGFATNWKAGYVLEIGVGGFGDAGTNDLYIHRSFAYVEHVQLGRVSLGHASQASDDIDQITTANTAVATRPLSLRPLNGPQVGEALDVFDGTRGDLVRYDTANLYGFVASASWASGNDNGDVWDVALRYAGDVGVFRVAAGASYRQGIIVNGAGIVDDDVLDAKVYATAASVMHTPTGMFVTGNYGRIEGDVFKVAPLAIDLDGDGWAVTAGIEQKFFSLGRTTFFGEYGTADAAVTMDLSGFCGVSCGLYADGEVTYYGGGIVQNIEAAATDLYATVRFYEVDAGVGGHFGPNSGGVNVGTDGTVFVGGARIKF
jgi:hypothetical protein